MDSHLCAYHLGPLLKQYPKTSLCYHAQRHMQAAPPSSGLLRSLSLSRHQQAPLQTERFRRRFQTYHRPSADHELLPFQNSSTKFDSTNTHNSRRELDNGTQASGRRYRPPVKRFAVLGGGVSGLATAYYLKSIDPLAKITIYEASDRVGGWISTEQVDTSDGRLMFEMGPRTLLPQRVSSVAAIQMAMDVGFAKDIIFTYKDSPEAGNRFVYYPDRLVKMPGGGQGFYELMKSLITEPVFKGAWKTPMHELLAPGRDESLVDESVSSFFNRRFGSPDVTNNIISAVIHGIYAGDIDQLSVKSLFRSLWDLEQKDRSLLRGAILRQGAGAVTPEHVYDMIAQLASLPKPNVWSTLRESAATYTFKDGMQTIPNNLKMWLRTRPNCEFMMGEKVTRVEHKIDVDGIMISTSRGNPPIRYDHCISALPAATLATLTPHLPALRDMHSVTVMVVNLFYRDPNLLRERGFGYLIPRSVPASQNPECGLGVIFDTFCGTVPDSIPGTKLTVMLGGHYWDAFSQYPSDEEGHRMAASLLKRHLGIDVEPEVVKVTLNKNAIPQYHVGHYQRMATTHSDLLSKFNGRLSVVGSSYTGVGVNDCITAALGLSKDFSASSDERVTGLESFRI